MYDTKVATDANKYCFAQQQQHRLTHFWQKFSQNARLPVMESRDMCLSRDVSVHGFSLAASPLDPYRGLSRCVLWSSFTFSRLDHCQCCARAVDWDNAAAGINMVGRLQQQRVTHGICIPAEASAASLTHS